jgi:hypothetical protein
MTLALTLLMPLAPARADASAARLSLRGRTLRSRSPGDRERAIAAASWLPELRVRATVERSDVPGRRDNTTVSGELTWPLDRSFGSNAIAEARARRQAAVERERLVDRIAETLRRRQQAHDLNDDVAAELAEEEADAEVYALTGRAAEDGP